MSALNSPVTVTAWWINKAVEEVLIVFEVKSKWTISWPELHQQKVSEESPLYWRGRQWLTILYKETMTDPQWRYDQSVPTVHPNYPARQVMLVAVVRLDETIVLVSIRIKYFAGMFCFRNLVKILFPSEMWFSEGVPWSRSKEGWVIRCVGLYNLKQFSCCRLRHYHSHTKLSTDH